MYICRTLPLRDLKGDVVVIASRAEAASLPLRGVVQ